MFEDPEDLTRVQRSTATRLQREQEMERKVTLMSLIQGLIPDRKGRILTEHILYEAGQQGFTDDEVEYMLDGLEKDGFLKRVDHGIMMIA